MATPSRAKGDNPGDKLGRGPTSSKTDFDTTGRGVTIVHWMAEKIRGVP